MKDDRAAKPNGKIELGKPYSGFEDESRNEMATTGERETWVAISNTHSKEQERTKLNYRKRLDDARLMNYLTDLVPIGRVTPQTKMVLSSN